ncbi:UDP-glycosyltransferase 73C25-like [Arachis stenosperma]|uniref:UDP-glycosyltransferase 73C25-like n=1 Tax=Arachis stenosperma TaxID=217475 RepID=UPI0025AD3BFD|nr:UDP-glycosyltransferase 73C25-like [Arachis stenosperma]
MVFQTNQPHFILFPLMAQGHIIPMMDIAKLLAHRGVIVTIFTTPKNASRFSSVLSRAISSGLQIRLIELPFPSKEAGLPEGSESFDMVTSSDAMVNFFHAITLLQKAAEELFEQITPKPTCIISDFCIPWTSQLAQKHNIPRISFHGFCCFCLHCLYKINTSKVAANITSEFEYFTIPGIPHQIQVTKNQVPGQMTDKLKDFGEKMMDAEMKAYGVIINTFEELEQDYVNDYKKERNGKVWCIGPVSLCNKDEIDKAQRGNKASINEQNCLEWLDLQQPKSVVYACLGSLCNLTTSHLIELALAMEATNKPFIWVIRDGKNLHELENWIEEEGFEERNKDKGLIIRGWAPQVLILSHPAVGGFVTHCGWNSTLEAITAGMPMITWPLFADQFLNEKLVTQVLKVGVSLGVEVAMKFGEEEKIGVLVKKEDIKNGICMVMDEEEEESRKRRARVIELSKMAKRAVEKGGSSYLNMSLLIQQIMKHTSGGEQDLELTR